MSAVSPSAFSRSLFAPRSISSTSGSVLPARAAAMSALWWSLLKWSKSAPQLSSAVMAGELPAVAAAMSGV
eukprot:1193691-Prorocentrum_minimum.AAC.4